MRETIKLSEDSYLFAIEWLADIWGETLEGRFEGSRWAEWINFRVTLFF